MAAIGVMSTWLTLSDGSLDGGSGVMPETVAARRGDVVADGRSAAVTLIGGSAAFAASASPPGPQVQTIKPATSCARPGPRTGPTSCLVEGLSPAASAVGGQQRAPVLGEMPGGVHRKLEQVARRVPHESRVAAPAQALCVHASNIARGTDTP